SSHALALDSQRRVWAWGYNGSGQLGNGTTVSSSVPVQIDLAMLEGAKVIAIAAGDSHSAALDEFGRLWMWGYNGYGQLGTGTTMQNLQPVQVIIQELEGLGITQVALGSNYSLAVDSSGGLWGWGYSGDGQLARES